MSVPDGMLCSMGKFFFYVCSCHFFLQKIRRTSESEDDKKSKIKVDPIHYSVDW